MEIELSLTAKMSSGIQKKLDHGEKMILQSGIPEKFLKTWCNKIAQQQPQASL